jgi:telomeric repeat-binding factor 2
MICRNPVSCFEPRIKKVISLLRAIEDNLCKANITEWMLEALEALKDEILLYDNYSLNGITDAARSAYCAIAVECTIKYLSVSSTNPNYFKAVEKIWLVRVHAMEPSSSRKGSLLFSDELKQWKSDFEASLLDLRARDRLTPDGSRRDALQKVEVFMERACELLDPSFVESLFKLQTNQVNQ